MDHRPKYEVKNIYWETLNLEKTWVIFFSPSNRIKGRGGEE